MQGMVEIIVGKRPIQMIRQGKDKGVQVGTGLDGAWNLQWCGWEVRVRVGKHASTAFVMLSLCPSAGFCCALGVLLILSEGEVEGV